MQEFLSTPSARRATPRPVGRAGNHHHFYPRPPRGGRPLTVSARMPSTYFYPRPPRGGRPGAVQGRDLRLDISIHALREEGDDEGGVGGVRGHISIHALREEGDILPMTESRLWLNFYPRPPRGGRLHIGCTENYSNKFLSTPSARRATCPDLRSGVIYCISIHALREEGDAKYSFSIAVYCISIHALREEGDSVVVTKHHHAANFYPRPPRGGRQPHRTMTRCRRNISIHALREEGDAESLYKPTSTSLFLSTPSARRATV